MKTFRISYIIRHGEFTYPAHSLVNALSLDRADAIRAVGSEWFLPHYSPQELEAFCREYTADGFAWIDGDRGVSDIRFEEVLPISIIVRGGLVQEISDIPAGVQLKVVDWDTDELDEHGDPLPWINYWDSRASSPAPDGD
jgi:hypothetical protein